MRRLNHSQARVLRGQIRNRLQEIQAGIDNPTEVQIALTDIKLIIGSEPFHLWFNEVHKLRSAGNQVEYEKKIFAKLKEVKENPKHERMDSE